MSSTTKIADDFPAIKAALEKLEQEKKPESDMPKAWPDFTPVESVYDGTFGGMIHGYAIPGHYYYNSANPSEPFWAPDADYVPAMYLAPDSDAA